MAQSKYVTGEVRSEYGTVATAICFGNVLTHSQFRHMFKEIWGAGFYYIDETGTIIAYGNSVSLNVNSREIEDAKMIAKALGLT